MCLVGGLTDTPIINKNTHITQQRPTQRDGKEYAIKILRKTRMSLLDVTGLLEEVSILAHLRHPNVIHFVDFLEDNWYYYVVTELVRGGELFDRIAKKVRHVCPCVGVRQMRLLLHAACGQRPINDAPLSPWD
jgi:serine/threonine protein kinase